MFDIVAEPNRRLILGMLLDGELSAGEIVAAMTLSQPAVSKHLKTLREAGLVSMKPEGTRRVYRLEPEPLRVLDEWLAPYRQAWEHRLDVLGDHLDTMEAQGQ